MKAKQVFTTQYTLDERDVITIKNALEYARHRITKHPTCGARVIPLSEIERLIAEFNL